MVFGIIDSQNGFDWRETIKKITSEVQCQYKHSPVQSLCLSIHKFPFENCY
jgi:hypothetical protein